MMKRVLVLMMMWAFMTGVVAVNNDLPVVYGYDSSTNNEATLPVVTSLLYEQNDSKVNIPQVDKIGDDSLQETINQNLKDKVLSLRNTPDSSIHGDFAVTFLNKNLLGLHFVGYSYTKQAAHPSKIDVGIQIDLATGKLYSIEDLFKKNIDFETKLKEVCKSKEASYRLKTSGSQDWTFEDFEGNWKGADQSFVLYRDSIRVYTLLGAAVGPIGGYYIPLRDIRNLIDVKGPFWKAIQID